MRTIKFRGKRVDNGKWEHGYLVVNRDGSCWIKNTDYNVNNGKCDLIPEEVIPETVGQFTGLTDKNGKEIYEGDIIFNSNKTLITLPEDKRLYLVKWQDGKYSDEKNWLQYKPGFIFEKIKFNDKKYMDLIFGQHQIEVIGNIHDNPELLQI